MTTPNNRVLITVPCGDGRIEALTMLSLVQVLGATAAAGQSHGGEACAMPTIEEEKSGLPAPLLWGGAIRGPFILSGNSNIRDARNTIAHYFKTKALDCDRLVMIDSDIAFTVEDFAHLMEGDEDIVIAPYARKSVGEPPVLHGCGFARVHRRVFEGLDAWMEDGHEALPRYIMRSITLQGEIATDYFYDGAGGIGDTRWFGEDAGFWHQCALNQFTMRMEKRTRLIHIGKFYYCYPDQVPGMMPISSGAQ